MSIECLNLALKTKGLTPTKKFILVLLANYADEKGSCYPSYRHIADIVGLKDTKGVKKAIKEFEMLGYLKIQNRKSENGGFTSNLYHLNLNRGAKTTRGARAEKVRASQPPNTKLNTKTYTDRFETFWKHYPRKTGKYASATSFAKAETIILFDDLMNALMMFVNENKTTEEKYIPHASTWLNQKRFLDYKDRVYKPNNLNNLAG